MSGAQQPAEAAIGDYWDAIHRKRWLIVLLTVLSGVFTYMLSQQITPRYEASAEFYVPQDVSAPVPGPSGGKLRLPGIPDMAEVYGGMLESRDILRAVAERVPGVDPASIGRDTDVVVSSAATIRTSGSPG